MLLLCIAEQSALTVSHYCWNANCRLFIF